MPLSHLGIHCFLLYNYVGNMFAYAHPNRETSYLKFPNMYNNRLRKSDTKERGETLKRTSVIFHILNVH